MGKRKPPRTSDSESFTKPLSTKSTTNTLNVLSTAKPGSSSMSQQSGVRPDFSSMKVPDALQSEGKSGQDRQVLTGGEPVTAPLPENGTGSSLKTSSAGVSDHPPDKSSVVWGGHGGGSPGRGGSKPPRRKTTSTGNAPVRGGCEDYHGDFSEISEANSGFQGSRKTDVYQKSNVSLSPSVQDTDHFGGSNLSDQESPVSRANKESSGRRARERHRRSSGKKSRERKRKKHRYYRRSSSYSSSPSRRSSRHGSRGRKRSRRHGQRRRREDSSFSESSFCDSSQSPSPIPKRKKRLRRSEPKEPSPLAADRSQFSHPSSNMETKDSGESRPLDRSFSSTLDPGSQPQEPEFDGLDNGFDDPEDLDPSLSFKDLVRRRTAFNLNIMANHLNDLERVDISRPSTSGIGRFKISEQSASHSFRLGLSQSSKHSLKLAEQLIRMDKVPRKRVLLDKYAEPDRSEAPTLEAATKPFNVIARDMAWPIYIADESLPFQTFSKPSFHEASFLNPIANISLAPKDYNKLEKLSSDLVKGVSLQSSLLETLFSILGQVQTDNQGRSFFAVKSSDQFDQSAVAHMVDAVVKTNENLAYAASQLRVQEAAIFRDFVLKSSSILPQDRPIMRSLPLSSNSLWEKKWFDTFVEKAKIQKKSKIEDWWFNQISLDQTKSKQPAKKPNLPTQAKKGSQTTPKNNPKRPFGPPPQPPVAENGPNAQPQHKGRGRGRHTGNGKQAKNPGTRQPQSFL